MKQILLTAWVAAILTVALPLVSFSQAKAELLLPESKVSVRGTSNLHDWEVGFAKYDVNFSLSNTADGKLSIDNVKAVFSGASVTSDNSIMTSKARNALIAKNDSDIVFISTGIENVINNDGKITGTMNGKLELGGTSRPIVFSFSGDIKGDKIHIAGSEEVNMVDYGIKPPTALLGTLKTGGKVTVDLQLSFLIPSAYLGSK